MTNRPRANSLLSALSGPLALLAFLGFGANAAAAPKVQRGFAAACPSSGGATQQTGPPGAACLGCHDGAIAPNVDVPAPGETTDSVHAPHPVGVRYADAVARDPMGFAPEWVVRQTLELPDGHVECSSCHLQRPNAGLSARLAHDGDRLCVTCHRK